MFLIYDLSKLTPRQNEVYVLVRAGQGAKEIANGLGVSVSAVKHRMALLYRKLGIPIQSGARQRIQANYSDTLKDCELNCMLAISSLSQRLERIEKSLRAKHKRRK